MTFPPIVNIGQWRGTEEIIERNYLMIADDSG
jgi:hypothetical protein